MHLDLTVPVIGLPVTSDSLGTCTVNIPLAIRLRGVRGFLQFGWSNPAACPSGLPVSASNALEVVVQ